MRSLCDPVVRLGFLYYFATKECKNVCVPLYMYRMNVWTCVRASVRTQSWREIVLLLKLAGPWFSLWGLTVPPGQEEKNVFL